MALTAPEDRLHWFLFTEVGKTNGNNVSLFTKEDERRNPDAHFDDQFSDALSFKDLYTHGIRTTLFNVEDHVFPRWHYRGMLTTGGAPHKICVFRAVASQYSRNWQEIHRWFIPSVPKEATAPWKHLQSGSG